MHLSVLSPLLLLLLPMRLAAADDPPPPPGMALLYRANITVGLPVDVGPVPAGNITVHPVIGGEVNGQRLSGKVLALGADWGLSTPQGYLYSDMRAQFRTMDNVNIYVQMQGIGEKSQGHIYVRTTFQTGHKDYSWLNTAYALGTLKASSTGFVVETWYLTT
ncbi:hypothetical protein F4802DRAFT_337655 [Xylaria palmicola]|nr:hypothetical protein F4802DRAFT_337655 [Xylaria palmicola]